MLDDYILTMIRAGSEWAADLEAGLRKMAAKEGAQ
jgi:hypothetical protein